MGITHFCNQNYKFISITGRGVPDISNLDHLETAVTEYSGLLSITCHIFTLINHSSRAMLNITKRESGRTKQVDWLGLSGIGVTEDGSVDDTRTRGNHRRRA